MNRIFKLKKIKSIYYERTDDELSSYYQMTSLLTRNW